jgi:hypothetical protein
MRKQILYVLALFSIGVFSAFSLSANATGGYLKANSICTANGVTYGQHGDGHWHRAEKKGSKWYAVGNSLGKNNPCS